MTREKLSARDGREIMNHCEAGSVCPTFVGIDP